MIMQKNLTLLCFYLIFIVTFISCDKAPKADFSYTLPEVTYVPCKVSFDGGKASDDKGVVKYTWDFGDGSNQTTTTQIIEHDYVKFGTINVTLTVEDKKGQKNSKSYSFELKDGFPDAFFDFQYKLPYPLAPQKVTFNGSASKVKHPKATKIIDYQWYVGFGSTTPEVGGTDVSNFEHFFDLPGSHVVTLKVKDDGGREGQISKTVELADGRPKVALQLTHATLIPAINSEITFSAADTISQYPGTNIVSYDLKIVGAFDIVESSDPTTKFTFTTAGNYDITVRAHDNEGRIGTLTQTIAVSDGSPLPVLKYTTDFSRTLTHHQINFDATDSKTVYPGDTIKLYKIEFGDGQSYQGVNATTSHMYTIPNTYTVRLTVTDSKDRVSSSNISIVVSDSSPEASFVIGPFTNVIAPTNITFNAATSSDIDGTVTSYIWDFGDGQNQTTTTATVTHTYNIGGHLTVKLKVKDNNNLISKNEYTQILDLSYPLTDTIRLGSPVLSGDSCDGYNTSVTLSPDNKAISILFNNYVASADANTYSARSNCNMAIPVHVPKGQTVSIAKFDYRGNVYIQGRGTARIYVEHFFAGIQGPTINKSYSPGYTIESIYDEPFTLNSGDIKYSTSGCGEDVILRVNTSLNADNYISSDISEATMINLDSADGVSSLQYHMIFNPCN
ncbi:MAG: PKD domain-containing protein [Oligoflexia bacterium]|nr:PKD domain-containing protein [Oligoflexia bacterium]